MSNSPAMSQSAEVSYPAGPLPEDVRETVAAIMREVGLANLSIRVLRRRLETKYKLEFTSHKEKIQEFVDELMDTKEYKKEIALIHKGTEEASKSKTKRPVVEAKQNSTAPAQPHRIIVEGIPLHVSHADFYEKIIRHRGGDSISNALLMPVIRPMGSTADHILKPPTEDATKRNEGFAFVDFHNKSAAMASVNCILRVGGVVVRQRLLGRTPTLKRQRDDEGGQLDPTRPSTVCTEGWTRATASDVVLAIGGILAVHEQQQGTADGGRSDGAMVDAVCGCCDAYGNILIR